MQSIAPSLSAPIPPDARPSNYEIVDLQSDDEDDTSPVLAEITAILPTGNEESTPLSLKCSIPSPPMLVNIQKQALAMGSRVNTS